MARQLWVVPLGPFATADGAAVTASGAATELSPVPRVEVGAAAVGEIAGVRLGFEAWGHYTTTATQGTVTLELRTGTVGQAIGSAAVVASTGALTWVASQTNRMWHATGHIQVRSIGTAGSAVGFVEASNVTAAPSVGGTAAGATVAIDTTVARYFALSATISVASQSITCRVFDVRLLN